MMTIKLLFITTSSPSYKSTQDDTWLGQWGRFGHDGRIGTCGHGKTNKKVAFVSSPSSLVWRSCVLRSWSLLDAFLTERVDPICFWSGSIIHGRRWVGVLLYMPMCICNAQALCNVAIAALCRRFGHSLLSMED